MSSKPDKTGVENVRAMLKDYRFLYKRVAELRKAAEELPNVEEEAMDKQREIIKALEGMDLSGGNGGWEGRMIWFINELDQQAANGL